MIMAGMPGQGFTPGSAAAPSSQVEISVSCRYHIHHENISV